MLRRLLGCLGMKGSVVTGFQGCPYCFSSNSDLSTKTPVCIFLIFGILKWRMVFGISLFSLKKNSSFSCFSPNIEKNWYSPLWWGWQDAISEPLLIFSLLEQRTGLHLSWTFYKRGFTWHKGVTSSQVIRILGVVKITSVLGATGKMCPMCFMLILGC